MNNPIVLLGIVILIILILLMILKASSSRNKDDYLKKVRELVIAGKFAQAAKLQLEHGRLREAYNLYDRGNLHKDALPLALRLGLKEKALIHAEKSGEFRQGAEIAESLLRYGKAAELYRKAHLFAEAAQMMERSPEHTMEDIAQMWETALVELIPEGVPFDSLPPAKLEELKSTAKRAADAHKNAGNLERAAQLYEKCQRHDLAEQIRNKLPDSVLDKMATMVLPKRAKQNQKSNPQDSQSPSPRSSPLSREERRPLSPSANVEREAANVILKEVPSNSMNAEALQAITEVVNKAVKQAIQENPASMPPPQPSIQVVTELPSDFKFNPSKIEVIHVRDNQTKKETTISRESERYIIGEKIGEGGMAVVYRATDKILEREVAMKFLPEGVTQTERAFELFEKEAKASASLNHPNIVTVFDFGVLDGRPFICMELIEGKSVEELLEEPRAKFGLPLHEALDIIYSLMRALDYAHSKRLIHRDIKPANILRTHDGVVKLMDFGIAKLNDPDKSTMIAGTPYYMAPEQFTGKGVDHRSDIFAAGVTMYQMLTNQLPFDGIVRWEPPKPPLEFAPMPVALNDLIMKSLAFDPSQRPQQAKEVLHAIRQIQREIENVFQSHPNPPSHHPSSPHLPKVSHNPSSPHVPTKVSHHSSSPHPSYNDDPAFAPTMAPEDFSNMPILELEEVVESPHPPSPPKKQQGLKTLVLSEEILGPVAIDELIGDLPNEFLDDVIDDIEPYSPSSPHLAKTSIDHPSQSTLPTPHSLASTRQPPNKTKKLFQQTNFDDPPHTTVPKHPPIEISEETSFFIEERLPESSDNHPSQQQEKPLPDIDELLKSYLDK